MITFIYKNTYVAQPLSELKDSLSPLVYTRALCSLRTPKPPVPQNKENNHQGN